jgi:dipeptidase E
MTRHVIACGGDGWPSDSANPLMDERILELAPNDRPRICLIPAASGDSDHLIARFYEFFNQRSCQPSHLALFRPHPQSAEKTILSQDIVYIGGGSTSNLLALMRLHGLDGVLREAYGRGIVMSGVSAGAICWFEHGLSNSMGAGFNPVEGLGLLPGGFCPHADSDPGRGPALGQFVRAGQMPSSFAVDDGAALHFANERLVEVLVAKPGRGARRVALEGDELRWTEARAEVAAP